MISALRATRLGHIVTRMSPATFAWWFAGYQALWFVGAIAVGMWRMWPR